jgi:hypothetical protein
VVLAEKHCWVSWRKRDAQSRQRVRCDNGTIGGALVQSILTNAGYQQKKKKQKQKTPRYLNQINKRYDHSKDR